MTPAVMDERLGRDAARYFGVRCIGVLGILVEAKYRGEIKAVKPVLDMLRNQAGYRISVELYQRVGVRTSQTTYVSWGLCVSL